MKILQTVKYYAPSKGGMESVVQSIVEGVHLSDQTLKFRVYSNSHETSFKNTESNIPEGKVIKEATPLIIKSQPACFFYSNLANLINDSDIIHHHYPFPNMELALLRNEKLLKDKKLVITWHANINNSRWSFIKKYYSPIIERILKLANHIVVTSPQLLEASDILNHYKDKVTVIPLSFDPLINEGIVEAKKFPENRKFRLLFVGKLRAYKGVKYLIEAIKDLDVILNIVGDGEQEQLLKEEVNFLSIQDKVFFHKKLTNEQLATFYLDSDIFVLPSINEAEAFGIVQLEAMSNGLPVINTNLNSGVPFVSLDNISGLTVPPKNSEALKNAILKISTDKTMFEQFSQNSIKRSESFSRDKMANSYLKLYNS